MALTLLARKRYLEAGIADLESIIVCEDCHRRSLDEDCGLEFEIKVVVMMRPSKQGMMDWMVRPG